MSLSWFIGFFFIGFPVYILHNYKMAEQFTNNYLFKKITALSLLAVLAVVEYICYSSLIIAVIFIILIAWDILKMTVMLSLILYIVSTHKIEDHELTSYILFFTRLKVRYYKKSDKSQIYFFKNNGVTVYFDGIYGEFLSFSDYELSHFKFSFEQHELGHFSISNFIVLKHENEYISLSHDDLNLIGVDLYHIEKSHFDLFRMVKI